MYRQPRPEALLVDDDESTREMMRLLLRPLGVRLITTQTASQALNLMKTQQFDLYILDVWLPLVDGFVLCKEVRRVDPGARILFYSGAAMPEDISSGYAAGADAYVVKPDIKGLVMRVQQLVNENDIAVRPPRVSRHIPMHAG